jgi:hypothetical protein
MSKKSTSTDRSSFEANDETSSASSEDPKEKSPKTTTTKRESIKNYVSNVLTKHEKDGEQRIDLTQTHMKIGKSPDSFREHESSSAFRRYQSSTNGTDRTDTQRQEEPSSSSDDEFREQTPTEQVRQKKDLFYR